MRYTIKLLKYFLIIAVLLLVVGCYATAGVAAVTLFAALVVKDFSAILFTIVACIGFMLLGTVFVDITNIIDKRWF